jgi:hypothetical protein
MRSAASCGHPLQVIVAPRGALTWRLIVLIVLYERAVRGVAAGNPRALKKAI